MNHMPAETSTNVPANAGREAQSDLVLRINHHRLLRQFVLLIVILVCAGLGIAVALWAPDSGYQPVRDQYDYLSRIEDRLTRRVVSLVGPIVGDGRYRAEVTVDLDVTAGGQSQAGRVSVAVAVDDRKVTNPETGAVSYLGWTDEELQRLGMLVRDAVGYSSARGDSVTVINTQFAADQVPTRDRANTGLSAIWSPLTQTLAGLTVLVALFMLLRPLIRWFSGDGVGRPGGDDASGRHQPREQGAPVGPKTVSSQDELRLPGAAESYDQQLTVLKRLIAEDPARVAQVMRQWVNADD